MKNLLNILILSFIGLTALFSQSKSIYVDCVCEIEYDAKGDSYIGTPYEGIKIYRYEDGQKTDLLMNYEGVKFTDLSFTKDLFIIDGDRYTKTRIVNYTSDSEIAACLKSGGGSGGVIVEDCNECPPNEPGPAGADGTNGTNGINGTNGADGADGSVVTATEVDGEGTANILVDGVLLTTVCETCDGGNGDDEDSFVTTFQYNLDSTEIILQVQDQNNLAVTTFTVDITDIGGNASTIVDDPKDGDVGMTHDDGNGNTYNYNIDTIAGELGDTLKFDINGQILEVCIPHKPNGDISIEKTNSTEGVYDGDEEYDYTITVMNTGVTPLTSVVVKDSFPMCLDILGDNSGVTPTISGNNSTTYEWLLGSLAVGQAISFDVQVCAKNCDGLLANGAAVVGDDPNGVPVNDSDISIVDELIVVESRVETTNPDPTTGISDITITNTKDDGSAVACGVEARVVVEIRNADDSGPWIVHEEITGNTGDAASTYNTDNAASSIIPYLDQAGVLFDCAGNTTIEFNKKNWALATAHDYTGYDTGGTFDHNAKDIRINTYVGGTGGPNQDCPYESTNIDNQDTIESVTYIIGLFGGKGWGTNGFTIQDPQAGAWAGWVWGLDEMNSNPVSVSLVSQVHGVTIATQFSDTNVISWRRLCGFDGDNYNLEALGLLSVGEVDVIDQTFTAANGMVATVQNQIEVLGSGGDTHFNINDMYTATIWNAGFSGPICYPEDDPATYGFRINYYNQFYQAGDGCADVSADYNVNGGATVPVTIRGGTPASGGVNNIVSVSVTLNANEETQIVTSNQENCNGNIISEFPVTRVYAW